MKLIADKTASFRTYAFHSLLFATAILLAASASPAYAVPLTGVYDTRTADGSKTVTPGDTVGPWTLTSTDATASWLRFTFDAPPTFADLTDLSVDFFSPDLNAQANSDGPLVQAVANAGGLGSLPCAALTAWTAAVSLAALGQALAQAAAAAFSVSSSA